MTPYLLKLYVSGTNLRTRRIADALIRQLEERFAGLYELVVLDVLEQPKVALTESVLATPLLVKERPPPVRRIVGDLTDWNRVLTELGMIGSPPGSTS
jgi:circadian clock protein KaiB